MILLITSTGSNHGPTVKAEEGKGSRENLKFTFCTNFKICLPVETYPQDVQGYYPSCAVDHLKTETDEQLKGDVEKQMSSLQVKQAVCQVAPPVGQNAISAKKY